MGMNFHWNNDHSHGASFHFLLKLPQLHCCLSSSDGIPIPIGNPIPIISLIQANLYGVMFQHSSIFCGIPVLVDLDSIKNLLEKLPDLSPWLASLSPFTSSLSPSPGLAKMDLCPDSSTPALYVPTDAVEVN